MKIDIQLHIPLKGCVSCEHCHTPLEHWGINVIDRDRDEAHVRLAKDAARAFGETWEPNDLIATPNKYFPHMMKQAAEYLASRVDHFLFCPYCGRALEQPRTCETLNGISPLPKISGNIMRTDALERWVKDTGRKVKTDWESWNRLSWEQHKVSIVVFKIM